MIKFWKVEGQGRWGGMRSAESHSSLSMLTSVKLCISYSCHLCDVF